MKKTSTGVWRSPFPEPARTLGSDTAITDRIMEVGTYLTGLSLRNERRDAPRDIEQGILTAIALLCDAQVSLKELHNTDTAAAMKFILRENYKDATDIGDYVKEIDEGVI